MLGDGLPLSRSGNTSNIDTNATEHVPARKQSRSCFRSCLVALLILVAVPNSLVLVRVSSTEIHRNQAVWKILLSDKI